MSLLLASGQEDATQRQDLYGAVYVLSGTLLSRVSGLASAPIRWGTRTFSGGPSGEVYEAFLAFPDTIQEELAFKLGDESPNHPINIPVRNLPFRHADSLLAAIVDEDYAWEGSQATLYVGYMKPGQRPEDLAAEDWTSIRKLGQFGSPQEVQQDGFRLPLFSRDSLRRQALNFHLAGRDEWPNLDPKDEGRVIPIVIGAPDSWIRMVRVNAGVYGFTVGSTLSGTTSGISMQSDFSPSQVSGLSGLQVYVHRLDKVLTIRHVEVDPAGTSTLLFSGNIAFNIPQGALIQQKLPYYEFLPVAQALPFDTLGGSPASGFFTEGIISATAFETLDGRIIPFATTSGFNNYAMCVQKETSDAPYNRDVLTPDFGVYHVWRLLDLLQPPALIPRKNLPSSGADVVDSSLDITDQPEFTPSVNVIEATKQNFPTGPGTAAAAFDGSFNTGYSLGAFGSVNFTFPTVPGGTFSNGDTIRSILHITCQGDVIISDGFTTYLHPTSASKDTYTVVLAAPANFNQTIRVAAQTAGGAIVYEVSWEHELQTNLDITRTTDVAGDINITLATPEDAGFDMVPIKGILVKVALSNTDADSFAQSPWAGTNLAGTVQTGYTKACYPTSVFANLQRKYLEDGGDFTAVSGQYTAFVDAASYETALAAYVARNIRLNFAITEPIGWADLERELSMQCRSWAFYGPNGHQLIVLPDSDETIPVEASFRLPGTPNPTAAQPQGSPLIERTSPSDIINRVDVHWGRQWHLTTAGFDQAERYFYLTRGLSQTSRDVFGDRYNVDGPVLAWGINNVSVDATILDPVYSGGAAQVQDLADFIADRQGFAKTRFVFETGWPAFGLTQGSMIRVAFAAGPGIYRNVVCEVEDIQTSPINSERRNITARSIGAPQRGLAPAIIWTDLFTGVDDTWADRFTNVNDRWEHYFGVPES